MSFSASPRAGLSPEALDLLNLRGYVVLRGLLSAEEVDRSNLAIEEILTSRSRQIRLRHVRSTGTDGRERWDYYDHAPNDRALRSRDADALVLSPGLRIQGEPGEEMIADGSMLRVRKIENYRDVHPFFFSLLNDHLPLRHSASSALRDEPLLYSCMALLKPPRGGVAKPWHQDAAYFNVDPLSATIGLWIALDPATPENGCMHVAPGWHTRGAYAHIHRADCEIADPAEFQASVIPIPLDPGDALLFSSMLPHMTPPNLSDRRRWSLQLHFRGAGSHLVGKEEYDKLFRAPDGRPASCFPAAPRGGAQGS